MRDIAARDYLRKAKDVLGIDLYSTQHKENLPENKEELSLHMQLNYKQSIEIAEEEVISNVLAKNKFDQTKK